MTGVGIYLYTRAPSIERELAEITSVPKEIEPFSDFMTACLRKTLIDALKYIGSRGGFYDTSVFSYNFLNPTMEGMNAVKFSQDGKLAIPYWYYMSGNDICDESGVCEFREKAQDINSVKTNIEQYINDKMDSCTGNFEEFQEKGITAEKKGSPKSNAVIQPSSVSIILNYPFRVVSGDVSKDVDKFGAKININLKEVIELANTIKKTEQQYTFLENLGIELINIYSDLDKKMLPPTSETTFGSGAGIYWVKSEVASKLKEILSSYIPLIQFGGTKNYQYLLSSPKAQDRQLYETLYNKGFYVPLEKIDADKTYSNLEVNLVYLPEWNPYFNLNCAGELCTSDSINQNFLFLFGIQKYNFAYDLSFPVLVEIKDPNAFDGEGYTFRYMLEANIRANSPLKTDNLPTKIDNSPSGADYCYPEKFNSGKISIDVKNGFTKQQLSNAKIFFNCASQGCFIGETSTKIFESKFPGCLGGVLSIFKEGYPTAEIPLDTDQNSQSLTAELYPVKELEVNAKRLLLEKKGKNWVLNDELVDADKDEHLIIVARKISKGEEQSSVAEFYGDGTKNKENKIRIYPGKYELSITSTLEPDENSKIIFPSQKKCFKSKVLGVQVKKECMSIPEKPIEFYASSDKKITKPLINGNTKINFTITPEMLKDGKKIQFNYIAIDFRGIPESERYIDDLQQVNKLEKRSKNSKDLLEPIIFGMKE